MALAQTPRSQRQVTRRDSGMSTMRGMLGQGAQRGCILVRVSFNGIPEACRLDWLATRYIQVLAKLQVRSKQMDGCQS